MLGIGNDRLAVTYHGITHTHLDSLAHINDNGVFYNGYKPDPDAVMKEGHSKNSIHNVKNGIFTRGVLIDIPRLKGVPYLEPGTPIYIEDLEAWERQVGVKLTAGDALFVRTGVWARRKALGPWLRGRAEGGRSAGLDPSVIPWLKERDIAILASDHPQYVSPSHLRGAIHDFALLYLGVHLFDNCDSGGAGRRRGRAESLGLLADSRSASDSRRDRFASKSHRDVLRILRSDLVRLCRSVSTPARQVCPNNRTVLGSSQLNARGDRGASERGPPWASCPCRLPASKAHGRRLRPTIPDLSSRRSDHQCDRPGPWRRSRSDRAP